MAFLLKTDYAPGDSVGTIEADQLNTIGKWLNNMMLVGGTVNHTTEEMILVPGSGASGGLHFTFRCYVTGALSFGITPGRSWFAGVKTVLTPPEQTGIGPSKKCFWWVIPDDGSAPTLSYGADFPAGSPGDPENWPLCECILNGDNTAITDIIHAFDIHMPRNA